ncbi:MAG: HU family DNA-binding protein [Acidimicrobiales bacterium]
MCRFSDAAAVRPDRDVAAGRAVEPRPHGSGRASGCPTIPHPRRSSCHARLHDQYSIGGHMNRRELVLALSERTEIDRKTVDAVIAAFTEVVTETVAKGDPVSLPGFAKFARVDTKARMGRNPATGEQIKIPARRKARITPLKAFKDAVLAGK